MNAAGKLVVGIVVVSAVLAWICTAQAKAAEPEPKPEPKDGGDDEAKPLPKPAPINPDAPRPTGPTYGTMPVPDTDASRYWAETESPGGSLRIRSETQEPMNGSEASAWFEDWADNALEEGQTAYLYRTTRTGERQTVRAMKFGE